MATDSSPRQLRQQRCCSRSHPARSGASTHAAVAARGRQHGPSLRRPESQTNVPGPLMRLVAQAHRQHALKYIERTVQMFMAAKRRPLRLELGPSRTPAPGQDKEDTARAPTPSLALMVAPS